MRTRYRALIILLVLVMIAAGYLQSGQYKLDPLQSARASSDIGKDAGVYGQVDFPWGKVYLFRTAQGPKSVLVTKTGFLWQNRGVMNGRETTDQLSTLCWQRVISDFQHEATVFVVESNDEKVASIEAGNGTQRIRKEIKPGNPVIFSWEKALELTEVNAVALSREGNVLYDFRYPRNKTIVTPEDLRWYKR